MLRIILGVPGYLGPSQDSQDSWQYPGILGTIPGFPGYLDYPGIPRIHGTIPGFLGYFGQDSQDTWDYPGIPRILGTIARFHDTWN